MTHKNPWQCKVMAWRLEDISIWKKLLRKTPKFLHLVFEATKTRLCHNLNLHMAVKISPLTLEKVTALSVNFPLTDGSYFNIARGAVPLKQHCDLELRHLQSCQAKG